MADSTPHSPEDGGSTLTTRIDYNIGLSYRRNLRAVPPQLKVLHNEDLLIDIFSFFEPHTFSSDVVCVSGRPQESTLTALRFACLTCRSFFKPASDLLWRCMESLTPLFEILPTLNKVNDVYVFTGVIQSAHMERFRMYAGKIRGLKIETFLENIAGHSINRLLTVSNSQPLFPALKALHLWKPHQSDGIEDYAPLFLIHGKLLSNIRLDDITSQNESLISSFLLHLSEKATALQQLTLYGILSHDIVGFLKSFRRLQHVDLWFHTSSSPITTSFLQDLQDLPDLRYLGLTVRVDVDDTPSTIRKGTKGFQALNSLDIGGLSTSLRKILQCFAVAPELKCISCYSDTATQASIQGCTAEMCRVGRNVKSFTLVVDNPTRVVGPVSAHASTDVLSPFIHCRQLSSLDISHVVLPTNLDEPIRYLSENGAWRNMQTLELRPPRHAAHSAASLKSLRVLAQCCPGLMDVTIPIDFTLHTPSSESLHQECQHPRPTPHHPLKCLLILPRNIVNHTDDPSFSTQLAGLVARFLEHYFPNLVRGRCQLQTDDNGDFQWWDVVKMVMEQLSSLRAEVEQQSL